MCRLQVKTLLWIWSHQKQIKLLIVWLLASRVTRDSMRRSFVGPYERQVHALLFFHRRRVEGHGLQEGSTIPYRVALVSCLGLTSSFLEDSTHFGISILLVHVLALLPCTIRTRRTAVFRVQMLEQVPLES